MNNLALIEGSEQELAILEALDLGIGGEENLEVGDLAMPPRLRISSANRPIKIGDETVEAGRIVNSLTGDNWESVDIVVLKFLPRTRILWPDTYSADNKPICKSNDGVMPVVSDLLPEARTNACAACPLSPWGESGEKPRCSLQRNFIVYIVETQEPAILTLSSTALKVAKTLTSLAKGGQLRKSIRFSTRLREENSGSWYAPVFMRGVMLDAPTLINLAQIRDEMDALEIIADEGEPVGDYVEGFVETPESELAF